MSVRTCTAPLAIPWDGLGLAICNQLCRLMGGDLSVESELERGTTFTAELPVCARVGKPQMTF